MVEETKYYYTDRSRSIALAVDTDNIESDCNVISFVNDGDWPVYVECKSNGVKRLLEQNEEFSFGSDRPNIIERDKYKISFDPLYVGAPGLKKLFIERAVLRDDPEKGKC